MTCLSNSDVGVSWVIHSTFESTSALLAALWDSDERKLSINAVFIGQGLLQSQRLVELNKMAITQMKSLVNNKGIKRLK